MSTAMASELAVVRERLDTIERLLEADGALDRARLENFEPDEVASVQRDAIRRRLIAKIFRPLRDAAERDAKGQPDAPTES